MCTHPEHKAVLEIIQDSKLEKYQAVEGGYICLRHAATDEEALEIIQSMLMDVYREDPSMASIKERLIKNIG